MTETSRCLYSHPKFLCTIGASIFSLQAHSIQQTFPWSRKFQRQFSHFLLYPAECLADSFMKQEPQKTISPLGKFSSLLFLGSSCPVYATIQERIIPWLITRGVREELAKSMLFTRPPEHLCQPKMYGIIVFTFKQASFLQFVCLVGNGIRLAKEMILSRRWHKPW